MPKILIPNIEEKLRKDGIFLLAGADEAGRGPLAGPVVCAMVMFDKTPKIKGLTDSKKTTERQREKLFREIIKKAKSYAISIVPNDLIDEINISASIRFGFKQCLINLEPKPEIILVDGNDKQIFETEYILVKKGDLYVKSISAASILAKVTRDYLMKGYYSKKFPNYEFEKHLGYGTRKHREIIEKFGRSKIHRQTFKFKNEKQKTLDLW